MTRIADDNTLNQMLDLMPSAYLLSIKGMSDQLNLALGNIQTKNASEDDLALYVEQVKAFATLTQLPEEIVVQLVSHYFSETAVPLESQGDTP